MFQTRLRRPRAAGKSYTAAQIAARYGYPAVGATISTVAILELGGGYRDVDIAAYCAHLGCPVPAIDNLNLGASNMPGGDADGEVALDMQCVIGATAGKVKLLMVWCPNTDAGFANGIKAVAADGRACAGTISWGAPEDQWPAASRAAVDGALNASNLAGVPWFAASGDAGSSDGETGNHADFPASSPYALGCGGTSIGVAGETAWSYGGGGLSAVYPRTAQQAALLGGSRRGVPDVAGNADPQSGYLTYLNNQWQAIGGTSAVSPMWAAAIAIIVSRTGKRITDLASRLYQLNNLTDVIAGSNGAYKAAAGYDLCTGLGLPNKAFFDAMTQSAPPAGGKRYSINAILDTSTSPPSVSASAVQLT